MEHEQQKKVLNLDELIGVDGQIISFGDVKTVEKNGDIQEVSVFIPDCCREGWDSCPHVSKRIKQSKRNIGL